MSRNAQAILEQFETLAPEEQKALCQELERRLATRPANDLHGEPLTDDDIAESARVTFSMLDQEKERGGSR